MFQAPSGAVRRQQSPPKLLDQSSGAFEIRSAGHARALRLRRLIVLERLRSAPRRLSPFRNVGLRWGATQTLAGSDGHASHTPGLVRLAVKHKRSDIPDPKQFGRELANMANARMRSERISRVKLGPTYAEELSPAVVASGVSKDAIADWLEYRERLDKHFARPLKQ